jgi:hypothetical protein
MVQPSYQRALLLLSAACSDLPMEELAKLSIGQRDAWLLTLREWTFGPCLVSVATCPACCDQLEITFNVADIRTEEVNKPKAPESLRIEGFEVSFRLPDSLDLAAIAGSKNVDESRTLLLERCLLEREDHPSKRLPAEIVSALTERMAQVDPYGDIQLSLNCPACGHSWAASFDIVSFFWCEIEAWAQRVLREVHILASAYGWREGDILAMSALRRQQYLEMVDGTRGI